ncbi:MAG: class B sortase [Ruminiclostridium sp.]|nr:class B sortase [Ruminiclostridium sp.]
MLDYTVRPPMARSKGKRKNAFIRALTAVFPAKGDAAAEMIRKVVFIGAVAALVITGGTLMKDISGELVQKYQIANKLDNIKNHGSGNLSVDVVNNIIEQKPYIREDFMGLYAENNDFVGWFNLGEEEKVIDHPVVQCGDNDKYLNTTFDGQNISSGTLYVDSRCQIDKDGNFPNFTIIYGHCLTSQLMFSKLNRYYYERERGDEGPDVYFYSFYKRYPTVHFDTLKENAEYKVFACCLFNTEEQYGEVYNYLRRAKPFESKEDFNSYMCDIMDRSVFQTDVDITYGDDILCMSTCYFPFGMDYENVRLAIFARKVREGESPEVDVDKMERIWTWNAWQQAIDQKMVYYFYRQWDTSKILSLEEN